MNDNKEKLKTENKLNIELSRAFVTLTQDGDCCGGDDIQTLKISSDDGGGGCFWILETERWAFDSPDELKKQLQQVINGLEDLKTKVEA